MNRLELFRDYMAHLNPAPRPEQDALTEYVKPPDRSAADDLAVRFALDPASSVLVVGWIGTGKTTQLVAAQHQLLETPGVTPRYVDVSTRHDLADIKPGVLFAIAGLECAAAAEAGNASNEVLGATQAFRGWALGWAKWVPAWDADDEQFPDEPGRYENRAPILKPPAPTGIPDVEQRIAELRIIIAAQPSRPVFFFDSLDRLGSTGVFRASVKDDLHALREAGVGAAIVGPPRVLYARDRGDVELFDKVLEVPIIDVKHDEQGKGFLRAVLRKRSPGTLLPDESAEMLLTQSGGVVRDLISIARGAGEEAYLSGAEYITPEHVIAAADRFGQALLLGIIPDELRVLRNLGSGRKFVPSSEAELSLLQTRRILFYRSGRHVVHPALERLI